MTTSGITWIFFSSVLAAPPKPLYNISTLVGSSSSPVANPFGDSTQLDSYFSCLTFPKSLSLNLNATRLYVTATYDHLIRKISRHPSNVNVNIISTIAGTGEEGFDPDGTVATLARLRRPVHAIENPVNSDVFISDSGNHCVRMVNSQSSLISTVAGTCGVEGYGGDGGMALNALFNNSMYLVITQNGKTLFISDTFNGRVRRVDLSTGMITTIAGNDTGKTINCTLAFDCRLDQPQGLALSKDESILYVAESAANKIRMISLNSNPMTISTLTFSGGGLNFPTQIALNGSELYILDHNAKEVKKLSSPGFVNLQTVYGSAYFEQPGGLAVNSKLGSVYVSDVSSNLVKAFSILPGIEPSIIAGKCQRTAFIGENVNGSEIVLKTPSALAFISNEMYIADTNHYIIRKLQNNGKVITVAGNTIPGVFNTSEIVPTMMTSNSAHPLDAISSMAPSVNESTGQVHALYLSDRSQSVIMKWNLKDGSLIGVAGSKDNSLSYDGDGGLAIHARVNPKSLLVVHSNFSNTSPNSSFDSNNRDGIYKNVIGEVYFVDSYVNIIRKILTNGTIVRVAGVPRLNVTSNSGDGGLALNAFMSPQAIAFDLEGNLLVASLGVIRKIFIQNGTIVRVAGNETIGFGGDEGSALNAQFSSQISSLYMSPVDDLYISDYGNARIRKISAKTGIVTTVAGNGQRSFSPIGEYEPSNALTQSVSPFSIIGDPTDPNSLYLVEQDFERIRKMTQFCKDGWTGPNCSILKLKKMNAWFETSMSFTGSTVSVRFAIDDEDFKYYYDSGSVTFSVLLYKETLTTNRMIEMVSSNLTKNEPLKWKFVSNGNYSAEFSVKFEGAFLGSVQTRNKLQIVNFEDLMSESTLRTIPLKEVAALALNPETYSNASNMVNTLSVLTQALTSRSVRNVSDLSETSIIVTALDVISSTREDYLSTSVIRRISSFLTNVSSELVASSSLFMDMKDLSTMEMTAQNILSVFSNCFSFRNFTPSLMETNVLFEHLMIVGSSTSLSEHLIQWTSASFQIHVKRNLNATIFGNEREEELQIPNQGGIISTPFELRNWNSNNVSVAVMTFGNLEKVKRVYSWDRDSTTHWIQFSNQTNELQQQLLTLLSNATSMLNVIQRVNLNFPFELKYIQNRAFLPVRDLKNPLIIEIAIPVEAQDVMTQIINSTNFRIVCRYWNETSFTWETNGCVTKVLNTRTVTCQCNHTTTFSAFVELDDTSFLYERDMSLMIAQIIVGSLLMILISFILLLSIMTCKKNPMKSRWILPFFSLSSLIIELLFSYIVANAIFISGYFTKDSETLLVNNVVKEVSTMISTTFFALAFLNYFLLVVRFLLFRYFYEIMELISKISNLGSRDAILMNRNESSSSMIMEMDPNDENNSQPSMKKFRILKRMTSKGMQMAVNLFLAILIVGYFVIFISLNETENITSTEYTKIMAGSLLGFVLFVSLLVLVVFVVDVIFEKYFTQITDETNLMLSKSDTKPNFKKQLSMDSLLLDIKNYFSTNDALSFRVEFIYFMLGVACFVISYGLGLSRIIDRTVRNVQSEEGVQLAFDVLNILFFAAAFGGHASVVTAVKYWKSRKTNRNVNGETTSESGANNGDDGVSEELKEILSNSTLCKIFEQYAKLEFSLENVIFWKKLNGMKKFMNQMNNMTTGNASDCSLKTSSSWELIEKEFSQWKFDHLDANASMELNFPSHIQHKFNSVFSRLQKKEYSETTSSLQTQIQELIEEMHSNIILNLSDTFSRFMFTESYQKIMTSIELKKEMNSSFDERSVGNC
ncbi:hypothetical protein FDP41_008291 [Naegleria fowleri]|uniref:RGS domain-containing protein n=1 Tax=Naegleria fowleri TaxID=5763 RepID=A0A6A5B823_NAEFO|nr:uncharacterized protein FDP41_008291 [Naegleria fowleri]KAF0973587.1 hypothetical protein FDP41_008291 [Naegleria fowleri]